MLFPSDCNRADFGQPVGQIGLNWCRRRMVIARWRNRGPFGAVRGSGWPLQERRLTSSAGPVAVNQGGSYDAQDTRPQIEQTEIPRDHGGIRGCAGRDGRRPVARFLRRRSHHQDRLSGAAHRPGLRLGHTRPRRLPDLGRLGQRQGRREDRRQVVQDRVRRLRQRIRCRQGADRRHQADQGRRRQVHHDAGRRHLAGRAEDRGARGHAVLDTASERPDAGHEDPSRAVRGASDL